MADEQTSNNNENNNSSNSNNKNRNRKNRNKRRNSRNKERSHNNNNSNHPNAQSRRRRKRGGRGRRRKGSNQRRNEPSIESLEQQYIEKRKADDSIEKPLCPICGEQIVILSQSIIHETSGKPAHFDCILKELKTQHELSEKERIIYLGGGSFGIIQDKRSSRTKMTFFVRKRIQYEDRKKDKRPSEKDTENKVQLKAEENDESNA